MFLMQLVTIFTAFNPAEADLISSRLEVAEFHPVIQHATAALSIGGYALGAGGILVQVPADEAEEVKAFLASDEDQTAQ